MAKLKKVTLNDKDNDYTGSSKAEFIIAKDGDDSISAGGGNDKVNGGAGNDILRGGSGDDVLIGGEGDDRLLGGDGDDTMDAKSGNDTVDGGAGDDIVKIAGNLADAVVVEDGDYLSITIDGVTTKVKNTELFKFDDGTFDESEVRDMIEVPVVGKTMTLTTAVDSGAAFEGTEVADTYNADNTGTNVTSPADVLDGKGGDDTLNIYGFATGDGVPTMSNIEHVVLDNSDAGGSTIDLSNAAGLVDVTVQNSQGATDTTVGASVSVALSNTKSAATNTVSYAAADTGADISISNVSGTLDINGTGLTTLNLTTKGTASTLATLDVAGATSLASVVITGDKDLTITTAVASTVSSIDASAFTGKLSVATANNATSQDATTSGVDTVDVTVKGGTGADTIDVSANAADNEIAVDAGAGNDTVKIATGVAYSAATGTNAGDSIKGGDGTDVLSVNGDLAASDMSSVISGFETLEFTADAAGTDMSVNKLGISNFLLTGSDVDVVLTGVAANATATITDANDSDLTAQIGTNTASDVINVVLESAGATSGSTVVLTNYETVNLTSTKASTDAASVTNTVALLTATSATKLDIGGTQGLTITAASLAANAAVDAADLTGALTATFNTALASYTGGTGADTITLGSAGNLAQGKTFAGGTGTDKLTATFSASQDAGILAVTGFETLALTLDGANAADLRNVTGLSNVILSATAAGNDFNLARIDTGTTVTVHTAMDDLTIGLNTGSSVKVAFDANVALDNLILDAATTSLTVTADDGDANTNEAMGSITNGITGASLTSITVLGNDSVSLGSVAATVTSVDASAAKGGVTVTLQSTTASTLLGSSAADTLVGGSGNDTFTGGEGNDLLNGGAGTDTFVFASTGAKNGTDVFSIGGTNTLVAGAAGDVLNLSAFLSGGSIDQNGGAGTAINAYTVVGVSDVNITNKVAFLTDTATDDNTYDSASEIAALIQGAGNTFALNSGGKAIVVAGDTSNDGGVTTSELLHIYYVDDSLDGVLGTVSASDVVEVATTTQDFDLDNLITSNFAL